MATLNAAVKELAVGFLPYQLSFPALLIKIGPYGRMASEIRSLQTKLIFILSFRELSDRSSILELRLIDGWIPGINH